MADSAIQLSNQIRLPRPPSDPLEVATKGYVDNTAVSEVLPDGGTTGQVLTKATNADADVEWADPANALAELPAGGNTGQVLAKNSATDGDVRWIDPSAAASPLPIGGTAGQVLAKNTDADGDADWTDPPASDMLVPPGGTTGQVLTKASDIDGDIGWTSGEAINSLPDGGEVGQYLAKVSDQDGDAAWVTPSAVEGTLPSGGTTGQVLAKASDIDSDTQWEDNPKPTIITREAYNNLTEDQKKDPSIFYYIVGPGDSYIPVYQGVENKDKALMVNIAGKLELVDIQNLIKHAFPNGDAGNFLVKNSDISGDYGWKAVPVLNLFEQSYGNNIHFFAMNGSDDLTGQPIFEWVSIDYIPGTLPKGGTIGQVLVKKSEDDYGADWEDSGTGGVPGGANVPPGGTTGQVLSKNSDADGDATWANVPAWSGGSVPNGGTEDQVLAKNSNIDGDVKWNTLPVIPEQGVPKGGLAGQVLGKNSNTNYDLAWIRLPANELPAGGNTGQILAKKSQDNGDVIWVNLPANELPVGGLSGQVLVKASDNSGDVSWQSVPFLTAITLSGYNALSQEEKDDPTKFYYITDAYNNFIAEDQTVSNAGKILEVNDQGLIRAKTNKYTETITGDGSLTEFTINHMLGSDYIFSKVVNSSGVEVSNISKQVISNNSLKIIFSSSPSSGAVYNVYLLVG